jgi:hypothetical protein
MLYLFVLPVKVLWEESSAKIFGSNFLFYQLTSPLPVGSEPEVSSKQGKKLE